MSVLGEPNGAVPASEDPVVCRPDELLAELADIVADSTAVDDAGVLIGLPLPVDMAWEIVATSSGRKWWRRLFTAPGAKGESRPIIGGDSTKRCFDGWLAKLIKLPDQTCRSPHSDAPIRHLDHITRHSDGGATDYGNGRGTCSRCNHAREAPGWHVTLIDRGYYARRTRSSSLHRSATTTSAELRTSRERDALAPHDVSVQITRVRQR